MRKREATISERKTKPEIFRYHDYREYLKDWLAYCQAGQSSYSLRSLSEKAQISVSNLSMILSGSRKLSSKTLIKLGAALGLSRKEIAFLEILVLLGNATSQEERVEAFKRLNDLKLYRKSNQKESEVYRYLTHWYYVAIREMSGLPGFKLEAEWIQDRLLKKVSTLEIQKALKFLTENRYIETKPDGSVQPPSKPLDCIGGVYRTALIHFHSEMLALAGQSIDHVPTEKRTILGYTLTVNPKKLEKLQHLLNQVYDEVRTLNQEDPGENEAVYQVELALFPLTKV